MTNCSPTPLSPLSMDGAIDALNSIKVGSLDEIADEIRDFNSTPVAELSDDRISATIKKLMGIYVILPLTIEVEKTSLWRVRSDDQERLLEGFNEAGPPEAKYSRSFRANKEGQSMFYCATSPETCLAECRAKKGTFYHLFKYSLNNDERLQLVQIGDLDSIRRTGRSLQWVVEVESIFEKLLSRLNEDIRLALQLVDAFFFDHISRKGHADQYRVTQQIFEAVTAGYGVDGVFYSSIEHGGGTNFAISANSYAKKICVTEASVKLIKKEYGYGAYKWVGFGPATLDHKNSVFVWPKVSGWADVLRWMK